MPDDESMYFIGVRNRVNLGKTLKLTTSELGYFADLFGDDEDDQVMLAEL